MGILLQNRDFMFTAFDKDGEFYMTGVAGGVAMYDLTLRLSREDVDGSLADDDVWLGRRTYGSRHRQLCLP